jgi:membrane AbrB-like protein
MKPGALEDCMRRRASMPFGFHLAQGLRLAETLAYAIVGGALLGLPGFPGGWMSGAILTTTAAALMGRPVYIPRPLSHCMFVTLGISLGGAVTPATLGRMVTWPLSIVALIASMTAVTLGVAWYLRRVHGWDSLSAFFAAAPGALSQSLLLASDAGADVRSVAIVQSVRVFALAVALPMVFTALGMTGEPLPLPPAPPLGEAIGQLILLVTVPTAAAILAYRLRLPGGLIVGAMLVSGILHGSGIVTAGVPAPLTIAAFVLLGGLIGTRFFGTDMKDMKRLARAALGALFVSVGLGSVLAVLVAWLLVLPAGDVIIAYAPGGLEAMIILAFALHLDPAYVGAHHLARFFFVSVMMPFAVAFLRRKP